MRVLRLDISNIRIIKEASLNTEASLVILSGKNASGKTSCLEALSALFYGRSFRTRHSSKLLTHDTDRYIVRAAVRSTGGERGEPIDNLGVSYQRSAGETQFRLNREASRPAELIRKFPLQTLNADIFRLVDGSPSDRRRFVDWGVFHVKHDFYMLWREHRKLLGHWNAMLKSRSVGELPAWKAQLVDVTERLTDVRGRYVLDLNSALESARQAEQESDGLSSDSVLGQPLTIAFQRGWPEGVSYADYLEESRDRDLREGRLGYGAHRFDLKISVGGRSASETLSRGQIKLCGLQLKLAQIKLYNSLSNHSRCLVLVDDLAAEVDSENQRRALATILSSGSQVFLAGIDAEQLLLSVPEEIDTRLFHVKQGVISEQGTMPASSNNNDAATNSNL